MSPLRRRMIEDMQIRNLTLNTQRVYVEKVSRFARHFRKSPEHLGPAEVRAYLLYLTNDTLASSNARLGADADRYSFIVVDLHHLLLAGFDRRIGILEICTEGRLWVESGSATVRLGDMLI